MNEKTAMITIAGRPNVGKSTLINALVGEKIAIVSHKPQTTRSRIYGIVNRDETQFVFLDTPGFHKPRTRLGSYMVDVVGPQELGLIEQLKAADIPAILVINKIDTVEKEALLEVIAVYSALYDFSAIVPISAKNREGLDVLLDECAEFAVDGPHLFPDDMITDQPERQIAAEILREKLLWCLEREVPHGTAVEIERFSEREDGVLEVDATIYCEKASHKGIIIGKHGEMLKKISTMARVDCERFFGSKVFLQTWVKVRENWRDNARMIRNFGYDQ